VTSGGGSHWPGNLILIPLADGNLSLTRKRVFQRNYINFCEFEYLREFDVDDDLEGGLSELNFV
jgi:hypothetical protein